MKLFNKIFFIALSVLVVTLPAMAFTVYYFTEKTLRVATEQTQTLMAKNTMNAINCDMMDACEDIRMIANNEITKQGMVVLPDARKPGTATVYDEAAERVKKKVRKVLEEWMVLSTHWYALEVFDSAGNSVASTYPKYSISNVNELPPHKLAYEYAMRGKRYCSDVIMYKGRPTIIFSAPVQGINNQEEKITGVVIGSYAWFTITDLFDTLPAAVHPQLFNRDGYLIAHRACCNKNDILQKNLLSIEPVRRTIAGGGSRHQPISAEYQGVLGVSVRQNGLLGDRGKRWGLLLETPLYLIREPVVLVLRNIVSVFAVAFVVFITGVFFVTRKMLSPVKRLTKIAESVGRGNFSARVEVTTKDEIGVLGGVFNQMSENIERHLNERKQYEAALQRQAEMLDFANDAIIIRDFDDKITYWNQAAERQYGWTTGEAVGQYPNELLSTGFPVSEELIIARLFQRGIWEGEVTQTCRNGGQIIVWSRCTLLNDKDGRISGVLEINNDITKKKQKEIQIKELTLTDELTGIYNRRGFLTLVQHKLKTALRMKKRVNIVFADMDGLKWINDTLGHKEGDQAILGAVSVLKNTFRESDVIARMGGDEFAVAAIEAVHNDAKEFLARLQENIEKYNKEQARPYQLSVSVGLVWYNPENPSSIEELLEQADKLMYEQKRKKKEKQKNELGNIH